MEQLLFLNDKVMKKGLFIFIYFIFTSCSDIVSVYPDLGGGYSFIHEGKYGIEIVNSYNSVVVESSILNYRFDSTYIIASQRPWNSIYNKKYLNYKEANVAFENSTFIQYWIIDKSEQAEFNSERKMYSNVYGPFSKEAYLKKIVEMGVPGDLNLVEENIEKK